MILHAIWFGGSIMQKELMDCIDSWKQYMPHAEIKIWNEQSYKSHSRFYTNAIKNKQWAFASDYARFDILNKFGGIYIDTDMLLIRSINPLFERYKYFIGKENDIQLSCGIISLPKNNQISKRVLEILEHIDLKDYTTIPLILNSLYLNTPEIFEGVEILHKDFFYPYPYDVDGHYVDYIKVTSFGVHLWNASWKNYFDKALLKKKRGDYSGAIFEICKAARFKPWRLFYIFKLLWK